MNQLDMLVDVSHVGETTFWDVINTTTKPIIASHSNTYSIFPVSRNLKDEQIIAIGKNGGVIHLNFFSGFVDVDFFKKDAAFRKNHAAEIDSLIKSGIRRKTKNIPSRYRHIDTQDSFLLVNNNPYKQIPSLSPFLVGRGKAKYLL